MKIGILTYHFSDNFGALFQAYALRKWFLEQGHDAEFINYHPDHVEGGGSIQFDNLFSRKNLKVVYLKLSKLKQDWFGNREQHNNFQAFRREVLGIIGSEYKTLQDLEAASLNYDLLVCGSDQIWNPSEQFGVDPVYFLRFAEKNEKVRRISYAASFGRDEVDSKYHGEITTLLGNLDGVSVREQSGVSIIKGLLDIEPACVPDPTILHSDYSEIMKPYSLSSDNYVFCYGLRSRAVIGDVAEAIADKLGADLFSPYNPHRRWKEIGETVYPCPQQWLYLMQHAAFVVTNSFHGTALSILLNKPFVTVGLQGGKASLNARALNLLEQVGLSSRFLMQVPHDIDEIPMSPINWQQANDRLNLLKCQGVGYLKTQTQTQAEL